MLNILLATCASTFAAVPSSTTIYGEDLTASVGQIELEVVITVDTTEPISGIQLDWQYPVTEIEVTEVVKVDGFDWFIVDANPSYAPGVVRMLAADVSDSHSGVIETFVVRFNVLQTATPGVYDLDVLNTVVSDANAIEIASTGLSSSLTVLAADADGDGYSPFDSDPDCDDSNASIFPGATEVCDGVDNNCDQQIDEGLLTVYYSDEDGDGYGDVNAPVEACEPSSGIVEDGSDCDDTDPESNPNGEEIPNDGIDQDCDGADLQTSDDTGISVQDDTEGNEESDVDDDSEAKESSSCAHVGGQVNVGLIIGGLALFWMRRRTAPQPKQKTNTEARRGR